eukprot:TRINITY_DN2888_c0_g1_i1.p2 TRINITY_DN2888_c0_g1~~TRINITY_DN2888_c0_g1_i1.p2  ORF type:complete len:276 (+),score=43.07 TRINITY_DN2888_c0_g1_i1:570-1397(+)
MADIPNDEAFAHDLNRMAWWKDLGEAYWATSGNSSFAKCWIDQAMNWIKRAPSTPLANNDRGSLWRTIEAGIRMTRSWPEAWNRLLLAPQFTPSNLVTMLRSFVDHGIYLRDNPSSGNWLGFEMGGLYTIGALFPELKAAQDWRFFAASVIKRDLIDTQLLADGAQYELSTGYHEIALQYTVQLWDVANVTGTLADVPAGYLDGLRKAYHYFVRMMNPVGSMPKINDAWTVDVVGNLRTGLRLFPNETSFQWIINGRSGAVGKPSYTSIFNRCAL